MTWNIKKNLRNNFSPKCEINKQNPTVHTHVYPHKTPTIIPNKEVKSPNLYEYNESVANLFKK